MSTVCGFALVIRVSSEGPDLLGEAADSCSFLTTARVMTFCLHASGHAALRVAGVSLKTISHAASRVDRISNLHKLAWTPAPPRPGPSWRHWFGVCASLPRSKGKGGAVVSCVAPDSKESRGFRTRAVSIESANCSLWHSCVAPRFLRSVENYPERTILGHDFVRAGAVVDEQTFVNESVCSISRCETGRGVCISGLARRRARRSR
eukprot:1822944-Pleurochrysis_carterae.AAC.1